MATGLSEQQGYFHTPPDGGKSHPVNFATPPPVLKIKIPPRRGFTVLKIKKESVKFFFACGELSSVLLFNFVQNFINCMCAIATKSVKKISPAASFRQFYFSISFKISLIVCVRLRQSL